MTFKFGFAYPNKKPTVKFITQIYHVNIKQGGIDVICGMGVLSNWNSQRTVVSVLLALDDLLLNPDSSFGVSNEITA